MIHKLMDIFGRKDSSQLDNSKPSSVSANNEETKNAVLESKTQNDNQTSAVALCKVSDSTETTSQSAENKSSSEYGDNVFDYLRSTARSSSSRDDCFGCKMTASIMITCSAIFAQVCMSKRKAEILQMVAERKQRLVRMRLRYLQLIVWGAVGGFLVNEWYITRDKTAIEEKNKGYFKGYFKF